MLKCGLVSIVMVGKSFLFEKCKTMSLFLQAFETVPIVKKKNWRAFFEICKESLFNGVLTSTDDSDTVFTQDAWLIYGCDMK